MEFNTKTVMVLIVFISILIWLYINTIGKKKAYIEVHNSIIRTCNTTPKSMFKYDLRLDSIYMNIPIFTNGKKFWSIYEMDGVDYEFLSDRVDIFNISESFTDRDSIRNIIDSHIALYNVLVKDDKSFPHTSFLPDKLSKSGIDIVRNNEYKYPLYTVLTISSEKTTAFLVPWSIPYTKFVKVK